MESHSDHAAPGQEGAAMRNGRQRALRAAFALIGALALSACGSARYPAYYTLHFEPSTQARGVGTRHRYTRDQGIALSRLSLRGPHRLSSDASRSRLLPISPLGRSPRAMVAQYLAERVRARSLFTSVSGDESRMATDFVLSGTLERLEEVDEGRQVAAVCTISAQLVEHSNRSRGVAWHGSRTGARAAARRGWCGERLGDRRPGHCRSARHRHGARARTRGSTARRSVRLSSPRTRSRARHVGLMSASDRYERAGFFKRVLCEPTTTLVDEARLI